ncbi:MAG TPA: hypothetical protein VF629_24105 [Hymenobacter sp.]|jgi:hypothetical protein|uniref:hypothetical protein n=1 Tax=Hymenobacter sp. TaxID=1898978 RepID=UPI002ED7B35E
MTFSFPNSAALPLGLWGALVLAACGHSGGLEQPAAPMHAQLVAGHEQMENDHRRMEAADSVMEAEHRAALATAQAKGLGQAPAFQVLESRHRAFMALCRRRMQHHAQVLARHAALERSHATGQVPAAQLQADHATMIAEHERMQAEHRHLVAAHQKMEQEHTALLQQVSRL